MSRLRWFAVTILVAIPTAARPDDTPRTYPSAADVRAAFRKLLDRPIVDLNVKRRESETDKETGVVLERLFFTSEKKADGAEESIAVLLSRPAKAEGKLAAVIVLHGTGGTKEGQKGFLVDLAKRGIVGVAIDARYHGERSGGAKGAAAYGRRSAVCIPAAIFSHVGIVPMPSPL